MKGEFSYRICLVLQGVHKDFQDVTNALEGERYRAERLEEQINDLTELHQVKHFIIRAMESMRLKSVFL